MKFFDKLFGKRNKQMETTPSSYNPDNSEEQTKRNTMSVPKMQPADNETDSYLPFVFDGVEFNDVFELLECSINKKPHGGKYFGHCIQLPLCFDYEDRLSEGRWARFYFFSGSSLEEIKENEEHNKDQIKEGKHRPMLKVTRDRNGEFEHEMTILK